MKLLIAGAGGFAKECAAIAQDCQHQVAGFLVPNDSSERDWGDIPTLPEHEASADIPVVIGVGTPALRRKLAQSLLIKHASIWLFHPSAQFGVSTKFAREGVILCIGAIVTEDCDIGFCAMLDKGVIVSHDCKVGDYAVLSPGVRLGGGAEIGEGATLGMGAIVLPGIKVGKWATIGAGAVVTQDIPDNATAVGVPANVIKTKTEGWHLA